ncbi:MAG: glycoside hydrolase domain-containing protein [Terriglobales bacterium]
MAFRLIVVFSVLIGALASAQSPPNSYLGFDRNDYPGDQNLPDLRQTFSFAGYWLNNPPGETSNNWAGKRSTIESAGFGFLVLFNGRLDAELKSVAKARSLGTTDARAGAAAARREGFAACSIIFLDQEDGGRMLPEQKAYIYAWVDGVNASGFHAGVYCSGIAAKDDQNIVTADDIGHHAGRRSIVYFVANDQCPPSPGCAFPNDSLSPASSGTRFADIWQFAQSPKRMDFAVGCPANYAADGKCYAPGITNKIYIDVDTATSADPSNTRSR